jgi:hypothetical protein
MNEKYHTDEWIRSYLEADEDLMELISGVHDSLIPEGRALPAIRFHVQGPDSDVRGVSRGRIMVHLNYLIVGVNAQRKTPLVAVADRLDTLLQDASGETSKLWVLSVERTAPFSLMERADGVNYWHIGGMYHFVVKAKPTA